MLTGTSETIRPTNNSSQTLTSDRVRVVTENSLYGSRLVAGKTFRRGDLILPVKGAQTPPSYRSIQIGPTHIENGLLAFPNHSCRPNAIVDAQELTLRAAEDVAEGEELTFFYPSTEWELVRPFICLCGAPQCIHLVAGAKYLPIDTLSRYFVNRHIRELASAALFKSGGPS